MKKKILIFAMMVLLVAVVAVAQNQKVANAEFEETLHDFGYIKEAKGEVIHAFKFVNSGNAPLIIIDAKTSCSCTFAEFPIRPIKPGEKGEIVVKYSPAGNKGAFKKTIVVRTNGKKKTIKLFIDGMVIPR